jgi:hypothetical protein
VFSAREYDIVIREALGNIRYIESKSWSGGYLDESLRRSLRFNEGALQSGRDEAGQMLSDLVRFKNNGYEMDVKWEFSAELLEDGIDELALREKILERIVGSEFDLGETVTVQNVKKALNLEGDENIAEWEIFTDQLRNHIEEFVTIQDYSKIREAL